jgi:hypothetical protein
VRLFDEKYRILGIINPLDVLVIIVLAALAFVAFGLLSDEPATVAETRTITYSLVCPAVPASSDGLVSVGDPITKLGVGEIGTVTAVTSVPSPFEQWDGERVVVYESELLVDIVITVEAEAQDTDLGYLVSGVVLRNNTVLAIATKTFEFSTAQVLDLEAAVD